MCAVRVNGFACQVYSGGSEAAWSPSEYCVRQGCVVHVAVLEGSAGGYGYKSDYEYRVSPSDGWADGESQPDHGGHVAAMCFGLREELGGSPALCRFLVQQDFSGEYRHGTLRGVVWASVSISHVLGISG